MGGDAKGAENVSGADRRDTAEKFKSDDEIEGSLDFASGAELDVHVSQFDAGLG